MLVFMQNTPTLAGSSGGVSWTDRTLWKPPISFMLAPGQLKGLQSALDTISGVVGSLDPVRERV